MRYRFLFACVMSGVAVAGCARQEPPGSTKPVGTPNATVTRATTTNPLVPASATSILDGRDSGTSADASADARDTARDAGEPTEFDDAIDATKPQTRDIPPSDDPRVRALATGLCAAFGSDNPELALGFFFPVAAYKQVKALPDPERDWRLRLLRGYQRDIHAIAKSMAADTVFTRLEIPPHAARWVEPNEEGNRIGYYRVYGTKLHCMSGGLDRAVDLKSLISWRGRWYLVHLSSFK